MLPPRKRPKLEEITLGRTGYGSNPDILCRVCQGPVAPKQKCYECYKEGRIYRKRVITDVKTQVLLKEKRREILERNAKKGKRRRKTRRGLLRIRARARVYATRGRTQSLKVCVWALERILYCFERDRAGALHIYDDRMQELRELLLQVEELIPIVKKAYPMGSNPYSGFTDIPEAESQNNK